MYLFLKKKHPTRLIFGFRPRLIHVLRLQFLADVCTRAESSRPGLIPAWLSACFYPFIFVASCGIADNTRKSGFIP